MAATIYRAYLSRHPVDPSAWVQFGHSLKEQGDYTQAAEAYRKAVAIRPQAIADWVHLAHAVFRTQGRESAIRTLEQCLKDNLQAGSPTGEQIEIIVLEMIEFGARERLPIPFQVMQEEREGVYAQSRYPHYRAAAVQARQAWSATEGNEDSTVADPTGAVLVAIYTGELADAIGKERLQELVDASRRTLGVCANVVLGPEQAQGALSELRLVRGAGLESVRYILLLEAGCRIEPDTIKFLLRALERTGAGGGYCDHDHWQGDWQGLDAQMTLSAPCLQPMRDPLWFNRHAVRPPCILVDTAAMPPAMSVSGVMACWPALSAPWVHVPLILASRSKLLAELVQDDSRGLPAGGGDSSGAGSIQVVIQTRDAPELLERCVTSLLRTARYPDRLDILVVNNRSVLPRTEELLLEWTTNGTVRVMEHDECFNWARANNLAVGLGTADHILFLNNDVEMDSPGWDEALRDGLANGDVGAIGALLLYPDRRIQHAGVIFGMGTGGPVHEGVGYHVDVPGPSGRWHHSRLAGAVTGAWLGTSRAVFDAVGGFEEHLPVAYNDIDFCLRCRASGRFVVQDSRIVAVHRESATRGSVMSADQRVRDQEDWAWMRKRWGNGLDLDPAYNPSWTRIGQPFDGLRLPDAEAVRRWIEVSARESPWSMPEE